LKLIAIVEFCEPRDENLGSGKNQGIFSSSLYEFLNADPAPVVKSVEYSRPQHIVQFECEVEVADTRRLILSAGSGTLFWIGQRGVSPQLKKTSLS
jgi:hypothetical protein